MNRRTDSAPVKAVTAARAFTVLEVLIAITVSLVLMLSLTRAFKFLSDQIRNSRIEVELSNDVQHINQLLQQDIRNITVPLEPQRPDSDTEGYFVYYEGPATDSTSIIMGNQPTVAIGNPYFQDSRYGDFDDYLAFTAYSPDVPFRGVVPKYLLLEKEDENNDPPGDPNANDYDVRGLSAAQRAEALEPVVIYSNYAEIIYWLQPEYTTVAGPDGLGGTGETYTYDGLGSPVQADVNGDGFPDRLTLHRRVLLIRPDLNLTSPIASAPAAGTGVTLGTLPRLQFPLTSGGNYVFMQPDPWPGEDTSQPLPHVIRGATQTARTWQLGMSPIHQQCDLSVRRVFDPTTGLPIAAVAANSLSDLTQPHNRFAHVRAPTGALGIPAPGFSGATTMPILAVGSQMQYIAQAGPAVAPIGFYPSLSGSPPVASSFNGFLRPEFALGKDLTHTEVPTDFWGRERLGEDIVNTSMLGFDVQAFDQFALRTLNVGGDGAPGLFGADDDNNGTPDDPSELGAPNTDDIAVSPSDPLFFEVVRAPAAGLLIDGRGGFVDLAYDRLAGGNVRLGAARATLSSTADSPAVNAVGLGAKLNSQFSLTRIPLPTAPAFTFVDSMARAGKLVAGGSLPAGPTDIRLFQPTYDTFSPDYEYDGFPQRDLNGLFPAARRGTLWFLPNVALDTQTDLGADGLDFIPANGNLAGNVGADDPSELETGAPFAAPLSSFRVRLRIYDQGSGQLTQQMVNSNNDF